MLYFLLIAWSMVWWAHPADAATYWVAKTGSDRRACAQAQSPSAAKRTIAASLTCLGPGDTLSIKAGTYGESNLRPPGGTSEGRRVTIKAAPGETVIVQPPYLGEGGEGAFEIERGQNYITLDGLIVDGRYAHHAFGIYGGLHVRLQNVEIRDVRGRINGFGGPDSGGAAIYAANDESGDLFLEIVHSRIYRTGWNNPQCGPPFGPPNVGCHGIYMSGNRNVVDGCDFADNVGHGIQIYPKGDHNVLRNSTWHGTTAGPAIGVYYGSENQVYNNLVYGNRFEGIFAFGPNALYANNTIYNNQGPGIFIRADAPAAVFRNNIAYHNRGGDIVSEPPGNGTFSHNLTSDPRFVKASAGDFHLTPGSPAIDTGMPVSAVTTDFDQRPRPQGAGFDIGAYEYPGRPPRPPSAPTRPRRTKR
jgi:hypothetical protein